MKVLNQFEAWDFLLKNEGAIMIDVRTPDEWESGVPEISSTNNEILFITISTNSDDFVDKLQQNIKNLSAPMLFLCYGCMRSATAATYAKNAGYTNCYNVSGGFCEWSKAGLPWIKKEKTHA